MSTNFNEIRSLGNQFLDTFREYPFNFEKAKKFYKEAFATNFIFSATINDQTFFNSDKENFIKEIAGKYFKNTTNVLTRLYQDNSKIDGDEIVCTIFTIQEKNGSGIQEEGKGRYLIQGELTLKLVKENECIKILKSDCVLSKRKLNNNSSGGCTF